jgi:hypothetical protein
LAKPLEEKRLPLQKGYANILQPNLQIYQLSTINYQLSIIKMALIHKNGLGTFANIQQIELALDRLKSSGVDMNNVSVVVPQTDSDSSQLKALTAPTLHSEHEFTGSSKVESIEQGAAKAGAVGTVVGGVVAALTTLAFPAFSGAVVLVGMATGAFYGAVSGGLLGGEGGLEISETQAQHYEDLLAQGHYLLIVKGSDNEIDRSESVLKNVNIQDWMIFSTLMWIVIRVGSNPHPNNPILNSQLI